MAADPMRKRAPGPTSSAPQTGPHLPVWPEGGGPGGEHAAQSTGGGTSSEAGAPTGGGASRRAGVPPPGSVSPAARPARDQVPWRTILATIGCVLAALIAIELVLALQRIIALVVAGTFLAVVLSPAVSGLVKVGFRRGLAVLVVFLVGLAAFGGLGYLFIHPLYKEAVKLSNDVPGLLARTQEGKGTLGKLVKKYHLQKTAAQQIPKLRASLGKLGGPAYKVVRRIISGLGGLVTVLVLTFLILLEGPGMVRGALGLLPPERSRRVRGILADVSKSVTGYVLGNVATSLIAGVVCLVALLLTGVPFATVWGVWVAMVDLLPLVGGLLAGVPTVAFAFLHSVSAGIILAIVFLVYQQIENHILNPVIMSRTVRLNPLWVILSVLAGAELAGIGGALIAIPAAASIQVIVRDVWSERQERQASAVPLAAGRPDGGDPDGGDPVDGDHANGDPAVAIDGDAGDGSDDPAPGAP
jgi:predicted PurR-regulated permease PerM